TFGLTVAFAGVPKSGRPGTISSRGRMESVLGLA
ncbi:MAG: hypothetical protein H6Q29_813, partial [Bacteroidetes bacterium]|nr:hypothetical protein [Bacteroidota bacterium]